MTGQSRDDAGTTRVLLAEDDVELALLYESYLSTHYEVVVAQDGDAALEAFDDTVDVVLLDRMMPRMDGDQVLETLRNRGQSCPVAMVTAVEPDFDVVHMGFDEYAVKPLDEDDLVDLVERLTSRTAYDDSLRQHYAIAAKLAALEEYKDAVELAESEAYTALEAELAELDRELSVATEGLSNDDLAAVLRGE